MTDLQPTDLLFQKWSMVNILVYLAIFSHNLRTPQMTDSSMTIGAFDYNFVCVAKHRIKKQNLWEK